MAPKDSTNGATDKVRVRYMVNAIEPAVAFYTTHLGFDAKPGATSTGCDGPSCNSAATSSKVRAGRRSC